MYELEDELVKELEVFIAMIKAGDYKRAHVQMLLVEVLISEYKSYAKTREINRELAKREIEDDDGYDRGVIR